MKVLGKENQRLSVLIKEKLAEGEAVKQATEQKFQDEKREEQMKVMTFVLKLEQREGLLDGFLRQVQSGQFAVVVPRLLRDFNVRLLGVDCGLNFLMEAPVAQWAEVVERQFDMQALLMDMLPDHLRPEATWSNAVSIEQDVDLRLGHPSSLQDAKISESPSAMDTDPLTDHKFQEAGALPTVNIQMDGPSGDAYWGSSGDSGLETDGISFTESFDTNKLNCGVNGLCPGQPVTEAEQICVLSCYEDYEVIELDYEGKTLTDFSEKLPPDLGEHNSNVSRVLGKNAPQPLNMSPTQAKTSNSSLKDNCRRQPPNVQDRRITKVCQIHTHRVVN